ncbi:DNA-formamidopyrimidine glycosylase family protein [Epilithonimonas sp.]|uniref:DNA-formamidopyrimidine glycosylase family protein n=1 Tax=Epilithonimonas sp. TaxID=2894511 RepID=UPI0035B0CC46
MPEGPTIVLMKEELRKFIGQKVISIAGTVKFDHKLIADKKLKEIRLYGKQTYLIFDNFNIRIHLLMFGSYEIDEQTKPDKNLRIGLTFKNGKAFFYTCSVKLLPNDFLETIDWEADVMSDIWDPKKTKAKLKDNPEMMVCDALMDQDIFSGVGNIIKNETLFRIGVQPESRLGKIPANKINELVSEARNYSFDFLKWKRENTLKKHWKAHHKKNCPVCGQPLTNKITGKYKRRSFYCETDQKLF